MTTARIIGRKGNMGREHVAAYKEFGVKIVDVGKTDIVSIASPDSTHAEYAIEALKAGSHVFCEKPLCRTRQELGRIIHLAEKQELYVRQNFPLRYQHVFRQVRNSMPSYGEIYRIEATYNWGRTHKLSETWRKEDEKYSLVLGGMIHMIDLVYYLTGEKMTVKAVSSVNKSAPEFNGPDTVVALCDMAHGGICTFTVDGGTGVDRHNHRLTIHGTHGGWTVANHDPTNKAAAIQDFVKLVDTEPNDDLVDCMEVMRTALTIEEMA